MTLTLDQIKKAIADKEQEKRIIDNEIAQLKIDAVQHAPFQVGDKVRVTMGLLTEDGIVSKVLFDIYGMREKNFFYKVSPFNKNGTVSKISISVSSYDKITKL